MTANNKQQQQIIKNVYIYIYAMNRANNHMNIEQPADGSK